MNFWKAPVTTAKGLVCADGVIVPRTRMLRKVLWEKKTSQKSLTALQWAKEGYVVNPDATGTAWKNNSHNFKATYIYYVSEEVHEDKEAAKEFLKSRRKEKKE